MDESPRQDGRWPASAPEQSATARPAEFRKIGVLVVDDDALVRAMLDAALRQHDFAVRLAADGKEAIEVYRRHGPDIDVVLLDVRMPGLDGPQTLAALEHINPKVRCCFMTGDLGSYTENDLLRMHVARVFQKPFLTDDLAASLCQVVGAASEGC